MNILVIGANGNAGRRIVEKALKAGHQVTGVVRREGAIEGIPTIVKDALQLTKQELTQFDVVVNATSAFHTRYVLFTNRFNIVIGESIS